MSFEADQAAQVLTDPDVVVVPIVVVHGAQVPGGKVITQGVPVLSARRLPSILRTLPAVLGSERVAAVTHQPRIRVQAAAWGRYAVRSTPSRSRPGPRRSRGAGATT